ncbi:MAG: alpha amylase [Chitinophagaceae bacterium]|nr:alpha amylase [Chitinophagaceae bacterium]
MQGWYWDYPKTAKGASWADTLRLKAGQLKTSGFTHVWFPPHAVASFGNNSNGYDPKDLFIGNQTTGLGTRPALNNMLKEFTAKGLAPVGDLIYNHRDGGAPEVNVPVKDYITTHYKANKQPFPSDRYRCIIPLGGNSGNGAGDYFFKVSSKTADAKFFNFGYKIYVQTNKVQWQNLADQNETEPNGGSDCGENGLSTTIQLGRNMNAKVDAQGCLTDEFKLSITANDFNGAGDTLFISLNNSGSYSDHRIYGVWSSAKNQDIISQLKYQTFTDFTKMPSGRGQMNFEFFKPHSANAASTFLDGDWDSMLFFYDYDQSQKRTKDTLINYTKWNWTDLGVRGIRMDAVKHFSPQFVGEMLNSMNASNMNPSLVVGELFSTDANELKGWVNSVNAAMTPAAKAAISPKIFDFTLRENLRKACDDDAFDVRNVFTGSLRDLGLSGFNVVTFANNHDFRQATGFESLIRKNPNLAYAYILTNNQLGVPTVFYPDYYGYPKPKDGLYAYHPTNLPALKTEIDALIKVLKTNISGSPSVDYLNRFNTPYSSNFISGSSNKAMIYQLKGAFKQGYSRDIIVAINFGTSTLKVDHQINTNNGAIKPGVKFTDILKRSAFPFAVVSASNQIYMEVPAKVIPYGLGTFLLS